MGCVLVVEDDPLVRSLFAAALVDDGYTVCTAMDGVDAQEQMQAHGPSVVILDLLLPRQSGWDVLRAMREHEQLRSTPVLVVSVLSTRQEDALRQLGATDTLGKPVDVDVLVAWVRDHTAPLESARLP